MANQSLVKFSIGAAAFLSLAGGQDTTYSTFNDPVVVYTAGAYARILAEPVAIVEGWNRKGGLTRRLNNPGALVFVHQLHATLDESGYAHFDRLEDGWNALRAELLRRIERARQSAGFAFGDFDKSTMTYSIPVAAIFENWSTGVPGWKYANKVQIIRRRKEEVTVWIEMQ